MPICRTCGREHNDERRKRCNSCNTKIRRIRTKLRAIEYLGGKCTYCDGVFHLASFEFHHKDPSGKDFNVGNVANKSWESIVSEIDKCELVCSNCHREIHSNYNVLFLGELDGYASRYTLSSWNIPKNFA
jgi:hypothetical protein